MITGIGADCGNGLFAVLCRLLLACSLFASQHAIGKEIELVKRLKAIQGLTGVGAITYALVEGDTIIAAGGTGQYSRGDARPVTADSLIRVGSITKTFTALAVMRLVEQGKLDLNLPVKNVLPNVPLNNPWRDTPVTLAMMLEHTAGLQDLAREEFDYPEPLTLKQAFAVKPDARQVKWQPGYHYSYTNAGAGYAGRIIETITRENYDLWFEREILAALGMDNSQLNWTPQLQKQLVTGYDADLKTEIPYWHTLFRPFGGLNTTTRDMTKFLRLFTREDSGHGEQLVSRESIGRMETPKTSLSAKTGLIADYGLGLGNRYVKGHRLYGHNGDGDGYLAEFAYSRESRRGYFVAINAFRHDILNRLTDPLDIWLVETLEQPEMEPGMATTQGSSNRYRNFTGRYHKATHRFVFKEATQAAVLKISFIDNVLHQCFSGSECIRLLPMNNNLFRKEGEHGASVAFVHAPDGNVYFYSGSQAFQKLK